MLELGGHLYNHKLDDDKRHEEHADPDSGPDQDAFTFFDFFFVTARANHHKPPDNNKQKRRGADDWREGADDRADDFGDGLEFTFFVFERVIEFCLCENGCWYKQ